MHNNERIDQDTLDSKGDGLIRESVLKNQQIDVQNPNWFGAELKRFRLEDETSLLKLRKNRQEDFV